MREFSKVGLAGAVGCEELGRLGLMDTALCCKICHSVERHVPGVPLGPCRAQLPGGGEALVCCKGKKQLLAVDGAQESQDARGAL
ncbi:MAG: hypothetical protein ACRDTR_20595 [Rubrobacter sp.]